MGWSVTEMLSWRLLSNKIGVLFVLIGLAFLSPMEGLAQADSTQKARLDQSKIVPQYPSADRMDRYKNDPDYRYIEAFEPVKNPIEEWFYRMREKIYDFFSDKAGGQAWYYVLMGLTVALVLFILYKAKVLDYVFPSNVKSEMQYVVGQENIHEINFEDAIERALSQKDYRLAIRLQYLKVLKILSTRELIHWKPNLTNHHYVQALEKNPNYHDFVRITRYFEFAWYGEFEVSESGFKEMKTFSDSFVNQVNK